MSNPHPDHCDRIAIIVPTDLVPTLAPISPGEVLEAWKLRLKPTSLAAYIVDLRWWAQACGVPSAVDLIGLLITLGPGRANLMALRAIARLKEERKAPATIKRRISALKSMVGAIRLLGLIQWSLDVQAPKVIPLRDSRGPALVAVQRMFVAAEGQLNPLRADRDVALLALLFGNALRVSEVVGLSIKDYEVAAGRLHILGKGRDDREAITLPRQVIAALDGWLIHRRGAEPHEPIFVALDRAHVGHRLTRRSVHRLVVSIGRTVGITTRPHGLRHAGVSGALDLGADIRHVARFSRHLDLKTLVVYDDNRQDLGGKVAQRVADLIPAPAGSSVLSSMDTPTGT